MTPEEERLYNAIESAIARLYRGGQSEALIEQIRRRYPSPLCFIESSIHAIALSGMSPINALYFSMIPALSRRAARDPFGDRPKLDRLSVMAEYLKTLFTGVHVECYYAVLLSATGILIHPALIGRGTENTTPFNLKETLSQMLQHSAKAVVLCHNHPSGTLQPSREDVRCTLQAMNATQALQVPMLDHIIIAHRQAVSLRASGAIATKLWIMQDPKNRLLRNWIDTEALPEG